MEVYAGLFGPSSGLFTTNTSMILSERQRRANFLKERSKGELLKMVAMSSFLKNMVRWTGSLSGDSLEHGSTRK